MKKKLLLLLALMAIGLSNLWAYDFSAVSPSGHTLCYNTVNGNAEVTYQNQSYSSSSPAYSNLTGALVIPSTVTYNGTTYSVTSIGSSAFEYCSSLTSVTIPNSVTSIGNFAFGDCSGLTSVTIPNSVTSIGRSAFSRCSGLTSVTIPNLVTSIKEYAFAYCSSLTSVTIPDSVTSIGNHAFRDCSGLTSVAIGNSVTSIGRSAFEGCSGLTSVTIPNLVTSIGRSAFEGCSGLTSVTIPNSVTSIGSSAFLGCSGFTSITVATGNTHYDSRNGCNAIIETSSNTLIAGCKNTTIPNSVTSIGYGAFYRCSGLTSVTIPNSVTSIGESAFYGCSGLTSVAIPNSVTSIGEWAFSACSGLTSVTIGNSVTSIGDYAFGGCGGLTSVTIGNSVTTIGESAFYGCIGLTSVTIPNSVTTIGEGAFGECSGLTSVTIGNSVTSIGNYAFYECSGLTKITSLAPTAPSLDFGAFYNVNTQILVIIPCGSMASYMSGWSDFSNFNEVLRFTFSATSNDPAMGSVSVLTQPTCTSQAVISAVPTIGYRFDHWSDGVTDNPYSLTVDSDTVLIAFFMPVESGIEDVCTSFSVVCQNGELLLSGAEGQMLSVYDIQGRLIVREKAADGKRYRMPYGGAYMVQVGNDPARKVVVVK